MSDKISKQYGGYTITLRDHDWRFSINDFDKTYDTYQQATDAIDRAEKSKSAVEKKKLDIPCISDNPLQFVKVTGLNAGNGNIISVPKIPGYGGDELFPDLPWVRQMFEQRNEFLRLMDGANNSLSKFKVYWSTSGRWEPEKYPTEIVSLETMLLNARKRAERTTFEAQLKLVQKYKAE